LRYPFFSAASNIGAFIGSAILSIFLTTDPDFPCGLMLWSTNIIFPLYGLPMVFGAIGYGFHFYLSEQQASARVELVQSSQAFSTSLEEQLPPIWKYRHYLSFRNLLYAFAVFIVLHFIEAIVETVVFIDTFSHNMNPCNPSFVEYRTGAIAIAYVVAVLVISVVIRNGKDAYNIKTEYLILAVLWLFICIFYFIYQQTGLQTKLEVRSAIVLLIGLYSGFCIKTVYPYLYVVLYLERRDHKGAETEFHFKTLLDNLSFRNVFYEYLKLQFCSENLLCWEAIANWNVLARENSPHAKGQALMIFDKFIREDAPFELNIQAKQREDLETQLKLEGDIIDPNIYAGVEKTLVHDLYLGSYLPFLHSSAGKQAIKPSSEQPMMTWA